MFINNKPTEHRWVGQTPGERRGTEADPAAGGRPAPLENHAQETCLGISAPPPRPQPSLSGKRGPQGSPSCAWQLQILRLLEQAWVSAALCPLPPHSQRGPGTLALEQSGQHQDQTATRVDQRQVS